MPRIPEGVDTDELRAEQTRLAEQVVGRDDLPDPVELVGGFDASYDRAGTGYGALVLVQADTLEPVEQHHVQLEVPFPYVPGLLAYRELPLFGELWPRLERVPDVFLVDGGGRIHPRRLGSASHMGLEAGAATIGVTKNLLLGEVDGDVEAYGDTAPIREGEELLGYALLSSQRATRPIYVSPGHRVSAETALGLVERCCTGKHKLPEPLYLADRLAGEAKRSAGSER